MEQEFQNLIKVWISALISISYCYYISSKITKGMFRLLSLLPIFIIFLYLPLLLSSIHFCGITSLFISWLANFKLLLFAFDHGPLYPLPSNLSRFFCLTCFPIKIRHNTDHLKKDQTIPKWVLAIKVLIFAVLLHLYIYRNTFPKFLVLFLYCLHIYLEMELVLLLAGSIVSTFLNCEIEPVFNEPYLSTSLQDFWSRRWNIMVSSTLRSTIHKPVQNLATYLLSPKKAFFVGVLASFCVSGLMHELIYFYMIRETPTWEVTWFFVVHGVVTGLEIMAKRRIGWRLNRVVSGFLVLGFVGLSAVWLFLPQLMRSNVHERTISECMLVVDFFKHKMLTF